MGEQGYMYNQKGVVQEQSTPILLGICGRAHSGLAFDKFECRPKLHWARTLRWGLPLWEWPIHQKPAWGKDVGTLMKSEVLEIETYRTT